MLRISFGVPPALDEDLCFRSLARDDDKNVAVPREPCTYPRKSPRQVSLRQIFEPRRRNDQVVICPRSRERFEVEHVSLLKLYAADAASFDFLPKLRLHRGR